MKSIRTRAVLAAIAAAALVTTLTSCAPAADSAAEGADFGGLALQLSFVKNSQNSGEYIADSEGFYLDEGFTSVDLIAGPTAVEASVASNKADVGFSTALTAANVIATEGMPVKIVGAVYQRNAFTILSLDGDGAIRTPKDLEGARIGITAGTAKTIVEALAKANDIDPASPHGTCSVRILTSSHTRRAHHGVVGSGRQGGRAGGRPRPRIGVRIRLVAGP